MVDRASIAEQCKNILLGLWNQICSDSNKVETITEPQILNAIRESINSKTLSYRYVLPTQVIAKLADNTLDCRCIQVRWRREGAFDARSICAKVIVPFDRSNQYVLGGAAEPYVNNPLRQPAITAEYREKQKDKCGWDNLVYILELIEQRGDADFTIRVMSQILIEIRHRLDTITVAYPIPKRIDLLTCKTIIKLFTKEQSGGERLQYVVSALFQTIGKSFSLFDKVQESNINAADAASGQVADLECITSDGKVIFAVEVKDRDLTIQHVQDKVKNIREKNITDMFFIIQQGLKNEDKEEIELLIGNEFSRGHNIYVLPTDNFIECILALFGENGRRYFLECVGKELNDKRVGISHKKAWANLLLSR